MWDLTTNETRAVLEAPPAEVWQIAFDPTPEGARHLAAAGGAGACANVFSLETKEKAAVLSLPPAVSPPYPNPSSGEPCYNVCCDMPGSVRVLYILTSFPVVFQLVFGVGSHSSLNAHRADPRK